MPNNKKPEKLGSGHYHRTGSKNTGKNKRKTQTTKVNYKSLPKSEINSSFLNLQEKEYKSKIYSNDLVTAINCVKELVDSIKETQIPFDKNPLFDLLLFTCKDGNLNDIIRIKALESLRELNLEKYLETEDVILRNLKNNINFKIKIVKIFDKSISVISNGNSYIIDKVTVINYNKIEKKNENFMNPEFCQYPVTLSIIAKEINELYKDGYITPIFREVRVLLENYLIEVINKNYPSNPELYRTDNMILELSKLINNLFTDRNIIVNINIRPYHENIEEIESNLREIVRRCNNVAHNDLPATPGQLEELKDRVNRVLPILYKLMK